MTIQPHMAPLWLDLSLWSADLANLERDIRRLEPFADSFHLDAADGHFVHVFVDRASQRPVPIPEPLRRALFRLLRRPTES